MLFFKILRMLGNIVIDVDSCLEKKKIVKVFVDVFICECFCFYM